MVCTTVTLEVHGFVYPHVHEFRLPVADRCTAIAGSVRRWASNRHCYRLCGMATKATELQPQAVRDVVVASGVIASLLLGVAKWINADVRTPQYFLQLACVLSGGLLLGVGV